jgi:O-Antigen ligase
MASGAVRGAPAHSGALAAAGLGFVLCALPGALGGMYFPGPWLWTTVAFGAAAALALVNARSFPSSTAELAVLAALGGLGVWQLLSAFWAIDGSDPALEARRTALYLVALAAVLICVASSEALALLGGVVAGAVALAGFAVVQRGVGREPAPLPFEGAGLSGSLDYSNALGILAAIGALLALGLSARASDTVLRRACASAVVVLAVALALSESRGAWLALVAGLAVALVVADSGGRWALLRELVVVAPASALGTALVLGLDGGWILLAGVPAIAILFVPRPARIGRALALGAGLVAASLATLAVVATDASYALGNRPDYWRAALDVVAAHPVVGSGAGSFGVAWRPDVPGVEDARNAHSLYLETLAELGPVGLALVSVIAFVPILVGLRSREVPIVPGAVGAYAAFVVHAGLDWDWQVPAVVLPALATAAAVLVVARPASGGSFSTSSV